MQIIKEDIFRKQLKSGLSGGYLFFGEEDYLKSFSLRAAREAVAADQTFAVFNDVQIAPIDYTPSALLSSLMPPPMMSEQKIVTISGLAISAMKQGELDDLCEVLSTLDEYDYNVLIISVPAGLIDEGNLPKRPSAVLSELSKYLTPVQFDAVSGARLTSWVGKHFSANRVSASAELCSALIERCGRSMFTLASEIDKLSFYVLEHGRSSLSREDLERVAISQIDSDAYALANAILDSRYSDAIDALGVMKFRRIEPIIILSEVARVVCDLVSVKALLDEGMTAVQIAAALKMNEYKAKLYANAASGKSQDKLRRALLLCSEADLSLKLSMQGYAALERLICTL